MLDQDSKLVTAQPADTCIGKMQPQMISDENKNLVTSRMAMCVVDLLEVIDINQKQRGEFLLATKVSRLSTPVRTSRLVSATSWP